MTVIESCIDEVVKRGLDDWIQAAEVVSVVRSIACEQPTASVKGLALEVIQNVVRAGLMRPGEVTTAGFREWDMTGDQALERIAKAWVALEGLPELGEICWLSNTPQGDSRARALA